MSFHETPKQILIVLIDEGSVSDIEGYGIKGAPAKSNELDLTKSRRLNPVRLPMKRVEFMPAEVIARDLSVSPALDCSAPHTARALKSSG